MLLSFVHPTVHPDTALKAARIAIQQNQTTLKKIGVMAKELGLDAYLTKYFEAIIGAIEG